jgi:hypothetical protein
METKLEQIAVKAVNQLPKSVVREIRTPRSVGAGGGRPPPATRWAVSNDRPYRTSFRVFLSLDPNETSALDRTRPDRSRLRLHQTLLQPIQIKRSQLKNKLEFNGQVRMGRYL